MRKILLVYLLCAFCKGDWLKCVDQSFCVKRRNEGQNAVQFFTEKSSVKVQDTTITGNLFHKHDKKNLIFHVEALQENILRFHVKNYNTKRFCGEEVVDGHVKHVSVTKLFGDEHKILATTGQLNVTINFKPLTLKVSKLDQILTVVNSVEVNEGGDHSVSVQISFPEATRAYGLPEHAEPLTLKNTTSGEPYKFYNWDNYAYPLETRESLYGTVPVIFAHGPKTSSGAFWLNPTQTFVDVEYERKRVNALFISESGCLDVFLFNGGSLEANVKAHSKLIGSAPIPQVFALGYHQSRYSYMNQSDVESVVRQFDRHDLPMDVIWLDIDYTDSYKYFTWNLTAFPNPISMQKKIVDKGRKLVAVIDPHYKIEESYSIYNQARASGYLVRRPDGLPYEGNCWPGMSSWIDYFNENASNWYSDLYSLQNFPNSTLDLYIWNDMNEPAVFDAPFADEKSLPKDVLHGEGWKHLEVHNMYGFKHAQATHRGLLRRHPNIRPFVLTRSFFAGSQKYAAVWTGDGVASWEYLRISIPMILSLSLGGVSFCGADVGGFVGDPSEELLQRWYQAGAWYPFFRGHSDKNSARREPYIFPVRVRNNIKKSLNIRYSHIPVWYTLFYEHEREGKPVVRPLVYSYPKEKGTFDIDHQWMVGACILVSPVLYEGVKIITVYFPGGHEELWYDTKTKVVYKGLGNRVIRVTMDQTPVFYRGGCIVFRKDTPRPSTFHMRRDSYNIYVFLDADMRASGRLYVDDQTTFAYRNGEYLYLEMNYFDGILHVSSIDERARYKESIVIGQVMVLRPNMKLKQENFGYTVKQTQIDLELNYTSLGKIVIH